MVDLLRYGGVIQVYGWAFNVISLILIMHGSVEYLAKQIIYFDEIF